MVIGPVGALRLIVAPWRKIAIRRDLAAIGQGQGRTMACWFRGLYGQYPRQFRLYFLDLTPGDGGLVLRKYLLFIQRQRIPIGEEVLSAAPRPPVSRQEALRIGANGLYASGGPLQQAGNSIVSCTTPLGIIEFAVKPANVALLLTYIDQMRQRNRPLPGPH